MGKHPPARLRRLGPGDITPDGCAVDLYPRLPVDNDRMCAAPPPATLLERGCGVGGGVVLMSPEQFTEVLTGAGLALERYLTPDSTWAAARAA